MKTATIPTVIASLLAISILPAFTQMPASTPPSKSAISPTTRFLPSKTKSYFPTGFMDIPFGTVLDSATSLIKAKNYRFDTLRGWQIKIYGPFSLAGGDVSEALLSFNPDAGFYEGYAKLQGKNSDDTNALYDRLYRIIDTKYRTRPAATKRETQKGGKRYWLDEWNFSTEMGNYSISMIRDKDVIHLTYKASNIAPQQPVAGDVHESGL